MKYLTLFVFVLMFSSCVEKEEGPVYGQWHEVNLTDSFGDETGKTALQCIVKGKVSNSVLVDQDAFGVFSISEGIMNIKLFDYSLETPAHFPGQFEWATVEIKKPDGEVEYEQLQIINSWIIDVDRVRLGVMLESAYNAKIAVTTKNADKSKNKYLFEVDTKGLIGGSE